MNYKLIIEDLKKWITKEYEEEQLHSTELLNQTSNSILQRLGLALLNLKIINQKIGLGGKTILELESSETGNKLPHTQLKVGDVIELISQENTKKKTKQDDNLNKNHNGVIIKINELKIVIALDNEIEQFNGRFKIIQLANEVTFKRMFKVLSEMENVVEGKKAHWNGNKELINLMLLNEKYKPITQPTFNEELDFNKIKFKDPNLNPSQKEAVLLALKANHFALIHGPPGTGKTYTLIEFIRQLIDLNLKVLVCGPSNVSVDNILERLIPYKISCLRVGHPGRIKIPQLLDYVLDIQLKYNDSGKIIKEIREEINQLLNKISKTKFKSEKHQLYLELKELKKDYKLREKKAIQELLTNSKVILSTLNGVGNKLFYDTKFDVLIIDEATQALEPECWIAMRYANKVILAGDHHQLPPTILSQNNPLENTLFQKLINQYKDKVYKMLKVQYRMNELIMNYSSKKLYKNQLIAYEKVKNHSLKDIDYIKDKDDEISEISILFIDTANFNLYEMSEQMNHPLDTLSKSNEGEAQLVELYLKKLLKIGLNLNDIAIITPYSAQVNLLKNNLNLIYDLNLLEIGTIDGFQGREKEVIILSLVRSNITFDKGFITDYRRLNVAITRAKRQLCIIGDSDTLFSNRKDQNLDKENKNLNTENFLNDLGIYLNEYAEVWFPDMLE